MTSRGTCSGGFVFLNNRHYDPTTGTFVSVDPLVSKTMQPYIYGAANPIRYSDPSGLEPGCGRTACSATSCGEAHAYAGAVNKYNESQGKREAIRCHL